SVRRRVTVGPDQCFIGFDAYRKVLASGIDVVLLCTPPGHRPEQFEAAVNAGKHIFTEKPIATDPVGARRFIAAVKKAEASKLTVVAGLPRRSQKENIETVQKNRGGASGDVLELNTNKLNAPVCDVVH